MHKGDDGVLWLNENKALLFYHLRYGMYEELYGLYLHTPKKKGKFSTILICGALNIRFKRFFVGEWRWTLTHKLTIK